MKWINLIPWIVMFFITFTWTIGQKVKPESWGPVAFKTSILWWISIIFVFLTKISPFYFFLMVPVSVLIASTSAGMAEVNYILKNKLPAEHIHDRRPPGTEGLFRSLLYYVVFLVILYFANDWFF